MVAMERMAGILDESYDAEVQLLISEMIER